MSVCARFVVPVTVAAVIAFAGCASGPQARRGAPEQDGDIPDSKPVITYSPPTTVAQAKVASGTNVRANQDSSGRNQNETSIVISAVNPLIIVGGANDARLGRWAAGYYSSVDGGATFVDGVMPDQKYSNQGDPTLAACGNGTILFGYLDYIGAYQAARLVVSRSRDGGRTWQTPGTVFETTSGDPFPDKPYIACAPADGSAYANRAYVSWTQFSSSSPIRVMYSYDLGRTWTGGKNVSGGSGVQGSCPVAGRNGLAYVFWSGPTGIEVSKTTDGGGTWSAKQTVSSVTGIGDDTTYRRNSFPAAAIDATTGSFANNAYVVWADRRNGDPDILFSRTTDGGSTWSAPLRVNDDALANGRDQFFPWIAVDGQGAVHVMWLDKRRDSANQRFEVYIATSNDGGATFDENRLVSDVPSNGSLTGFLGDYSGLAASAGKIIPLWSDLRAGTGEEDVYIERATAFRYDSVTGVAFDADRQTLRFDDQEPRLGASIVYDVVTGDVTDLATGSAWSTASCSANDVPVPPATVTDVPLAGRALYVLVRAQGPAGTGSYGRGSEHPNPRDGFDDHSPCN